MNIRRPAVSLDRNAQLKLAGGVAALAVAVALYTRYSVNGLLARDEGIYVYGGQRMLHGVAPYASIFDPKTPLATMLCGLGAAIAKLIGVDDVHMIRLEFLAFSVLTVVAIYVLVLRMWNSVVGALVAAVVFASFQGFAEDAIAGPDAKTPGVLFAVVMMWLVARRSWFLAGVFGGLTFLVWQPFFFLPALAVLAAVAAAPTARWRALALSAGGVLAPIVATFVYFAAAGQMSAFIESAFRFPLEGVQRTHETVGQRWRHIAHVVEQFYGFSGVLFWIGLGLLLLVAVWRIVRARDARRAVLLDPFSLVIVGTLLGELVYASTDFQSYPDVFPLLPYAAIGFGAAVSLALGAAAKPAAVRAGAGAALAGALALTALSAVWFSDAKANDNELVTERAAACALNRLVVPGEPLYALGDPVPLVLTHRANPDRFIFLQSGVDRWKVDHTAGGLSGWIREIEDAHPSVIVVNGWKGKLRVAVTDALRAAGYERGYIGSWRVLVTPQVRAGAASAGVTVTRIPTKGPRTDSGQVFRARNCGHS